jgi:hypothetical protein
MVDLTLKTPADAKRILDHFNGFHDGFIKEIALRSRDSFFREGPEITDIVLELTGAFDVMVEFAHYNYAAGTQPHDRVVRCSFEGVREFHLDLRDLQHHDWPILEVAIEPSEPAEGDRSPGSRFALSVRRNRLVENQWIPRTDRLFTFERARFEES